MAGRCLADTKDISVFCALARRLRYKLKRVRYLKYKQKGRLLSKVQNIKKVYVLAGVLMLSSMNVLSAKD